MHFFYSRSKAVFVFRNLLFSEILNENGSVILSEKIANYDTEQFCAVLVWLIHEVVTNPIGTMHTTSEHSDKVRKRVAREQIKPIAEYNDNGGEIACEKCLFGLDEYRTAVYMVALLKTGIIRIDGKKIKWAAIALNKQNALVDEEVGQWWNLNEDDDDIDDEEDEEDDNANVSGQANESSDSEDDDFENNNNPGKHTVNTDLYCLLSCTNLISICVYFVIAIR